MAATKRRSDEATEGLAPGRISAPSPASLRRFVAPSLSRSAFTLTEILIVIGLIVLLIALAVPTFNFLSGGRSVDAAQNQISAMLGRARSEAIGLQEIRGLFFFIEPRTDRVMMALVRETERPRNPNFLLGPPNFVGTLVKVFLDLVPDTEFVSLPSGVGLQVLDDVEIDDNGTPSNSADDFRKDDGYIGFNTFNRGNQSHSGSHTDPINTITPYGGVILFDGSGRLIHRTYALKTYIGDPTISSSIEATRMGDLLFKPTGALKPRDHVPGSPSPVYDVVPRLTNFVAPSLHPMRSSVGIILFDKEGFRNFPRHTNQPWVLQEYDPEIYNDAQAYDGSEPWRERKEEDWLDTNATALLVNRYNGTLVKGE